MKRYIASDFHVRNEVADYDRVMAFLELVDDDADEFVILGDWLELVWSNLNVLTGTRPYSDIINKTRDMATRKSVVEILGNHDWSLGAFKSAISPVQIIKPFAENGVYYCHGHEFDWLSIITGTPVDPVWWNVAFPLVFPLQFPLWLMTKLWLGDEDKYDWGVALVDSFAARHAREHGYNTMLLGHTHYPEDTMVDGIRLVNTGDMLGSYTYVVEEYGIIELKHF